MEWIGDLERAFAASIFPNRIPIAIALALALIGLLVVARRRGWGGVVRRHPARTAVAAALTLVIVAPLGWYLASPLVLSTTIDEPAPSVAALPSPPRASPSTTAQSASPASPVAGPTATPLPTPTPAPTPSPIELAGAFSGADDFHFGRGTARLIETSPGTFVVRLEDFEVRNGPDLFVYLSPDAEGYADGALELARLKADKGNQNYSVPPGFDPAGAASVVIWCRQFSVQFAVAPLGPTEV